MDRQLSPKPERWPLRWRPLVTPLALVGALVVAGLGVAPPAGSQGAAGPAGSPELRLVSQLGGRPHGLVLDGAQVYWSVGRTVAVGVLDGGTIRPIGISEPHGAEVLELAVAAGRIYAAAGAAGLWVLDATDLARPVVLGSVDTPGSAHAVAVWGDTVVVADGVLGGLQVIDASGRLPRLAGTVQTPGDAAAVAVRDGFAFVADGPFGLAVVDLRGPGRPRLADATLPSGISATTVAVAGDLAVVADPAVGFRVLSIADPLSVSPVGLLRADWHVVELELSGDSAYGLAQTPDKRWWRLVTFSLKVPSAPVLETVRGLSGDYTGLAASGDSVLLSAGTEAMGTVYRLPAGDPVAPVALAWELPTALSSIADMGAGGLVVAGRSDSETWAVDLRLPDRPGVPRRLSLPSPAVAVGEMAYFVASESVEGGQPTTQLRAKRLTAPDFKLTEIDIRLRNAFNSRSTLRVGGEYLYLAMSDSLVTASVQDPDEPVRLAERRLPDLARTLAVSGDRALLGLDRGQVAVLDLASQVYPKVTAVLAAEYANGDPLEIRGHLGYLVSGTGPDRMLRILDLEDPVNPVWRGELPLASTSLAVTARHIFASSGPQLQALDNANPDQPLLRVETAVADSVTALRALPDGRVLVATRTGGLLVYEVMEPAPESPSPSPTPEPTSTSAPPATATPSQTPQPTATRATVAPPNPRPYAIHLPAAWH
jgi:hypothetical protein